MSTLLILFCVWGAFLGVVMGVFFYKTLMDEIEVRRKAWARKRKEYRPPWRCRTFGHQWADSGLRIGVIAFLESPLEICDRCGGGRYMHLMSMMHFTPDAVSKYLAEVNEKESGKVANISGGVKLEKVADNTTPVPPEKGPYAT
jgi:hypothetical protein